MTKLRSHQLDIYGAWLHLATDEKSWRSMRKRLPSLDKEVPGASGSVSLTLHTATNGRVTPHLSIYVDVPGHNDQRDLLDTIAHEATHAGTALLDHIGQEYDSTNGEALAYLVGWITGWVWEGCN